MYQRSRPPILAALFGALFLILPNHTVADSAKKTNVLFIISDDLNYMLGATGHPECKTPHLDTFAETAVSFSRAYCQFPLCGPSRASIMSGRYPAANGVLSNGRTIDRKLVTLPSHFQAHGYWTARVSKIYHMGIPVDIIQGTSGGDHPASWNLAQNIRALETMTPGKVVDYTLPDDPKTFPTARAEWTAARDAGRPYKMPRGARGHYAVVEVADANDALLADVMATDRAIELLQQRADQDTPFFLAVGLVRPHFPFVSTTSDLAPYTADELTVPHVPADDYNDIPALAINARLDFKPDPIRQLRRGYYGAVSHMDRQTGRLLAELDRLDLRRDTLVVFVSDHGYLLGEHHMWKKTKLWEEAIHVPLLISPPTGSEFTTRGQTCARPVELLDLFPTLTQLAALPPAPDAQGLSLLPLLQDPTAGRPAKPDALSQIKTGHCLRTEKWAYMWYPKMKKKKEGFMLFDMDADPHQYTNLADDPDHAETRNTLHQRLLRRLELAEK